MVPLTREQESSLQQVDSCPSIHLSLEHIETINLALDLPVAYR